MNRFGQFNSSRDGAEEWPVEPFVVDLSRFARDI